MNLFSLQPCMGAKKCILASVWRMQMVTARDAKGLTQKWLVLNQCKSPTEAPRSCLLGTWWVASPGWCLREIFGRCHENRYACYWSQDVHVRREWEDHVLGTCQESCQFLGLSPAHDSAQDHHPLLHAESILVLSFGLPKLLQILQPVGSGLHVGITNTGWTRVPQFLLCFAFHFASLGTFSKTLKWIGLTSEYFAF